VRDGKGRKDRVTILPEAVAVALQTHLRSVKTQHTLALQRGYGGVELVVPSAARSSSTRTVLPLRS
jgi:hypothetical protein